MRTFVGLSPLRVFSIELQCIKTNFALPKIVNIPMYIFSYFFRKEFCLKHVTLFLLFFYLNCQEGQSYLFHTINFKFYRNQIYSFERIGDKAVCHSLVKKPSRCLRKTRSSRPEVPCKKGVLRNYVKFKNPATLLKKRLWHRCFPMNSVKFLRILFIIEHLWWLLLKTYLVRITFLRT